MSGKAMRRLRSWVFLCSWPERKRLVGVGPQSVRRSGPAGNPLARMKSSSVGAVFQAPVDR